MALKFFAYKQYAAVSGYTGQERYVQIPREYEGLPVTEIRDEAFARNNTIECVFVPLTLQAIGANAFSDCGKLCFIGITPEEFIDDAPVFEEKPAPSHLPADVRTIAAGAFKGTSLKNIVLPADTLELGDSVFEGCGSLNTVSLPNCTRLTLGTRVFMDSGLTGFKAPKVRMDTLPEYTFANCSALTEVSMRINAVETRAFIGCEKLETLNVPKDLRHIGREAFDGCYSLKGVKIPKRRTTPKVKPLKEEELVQAEEAPAPAAGKPIAEKKSSLGNPLFVLQVNFRTNPNRALPSRLKGVWGKSDRAYHFSVHFPSAYCDIAFQVPHQQIVSIAPLIDHIIREGLTVSLLGIQEGDTYAVHELQPPPRSSGNDLSPAFFKMILGRLQQSVPTDVNPEDMLPPFALRTPDEYEAFLDICSDRIPAWVIQAYNKNKETMARRVGRFGEDESKHAQRAQELLLNIDWFPHVLNVPPSHEVRRILDEEFHGLDAVKDRIVEVVAQIRRSNKLPKWGILLSGPAGTGKTSIAKAVARIFHMPLIRMDLSALGDSPDEVSGSSRIYTNARPGMLLEHMFRVRSSTAVLLANEVDKAGDSKGGRNAADILLSILDKTGFYEKFLEETVPTDNLFCIGTCNDLEAISGPIRDRFLVIDIAAYTFDEKKAIFNNYVLPPILQRDNIPENTLLLEDDAVDLLVSEYTLEAGARDLEQYAERFVGNYSVYAEAQEDPNAPRVYTCQDIKDIFGPGKVLRRHLAATPGQINTAFYYNGLAHFFLVEASIFPGSGGFKVLGPIADLQKEYCEVAYWCARNTISSTVCDFGKHDVVIFVPQAIPDGADNFVGLACYAALCSKLMNVDLAINDTCFIGGCDMNGSLYFDENDLTPLLRAMKARGVSTVFAPMGTNRLVNPKATTDCNVAIVEAPDAPTLFSLAAAHSKRH